MIRVLIICFAVIAFNGYTQTEMMLNGGFEDYTASPPATPATPNFYSINHAEHWHLLNATPDFLHTSTLTDPVGGLQYSPRTGVGHADFVWSSSSGVGEYLYGETSPLTAGETYEVTFYVQKVSGLEGMSMGLYISPSVPTPVAEPYSETVVPQIRVFPSSGGYEKVTSCYTALQSGTHYLTFGWFTSQPEVPPIQVVNLDDVSVRTMAPGASSNAVVTIPASTFCLGDVITADGSASTDETDHQWEIYELVNGAEQLVYNGITQDGTAGTFNVSNALASAGHTVQGGNCYRVYLKTFFNCPDLAFVDFCVVDPDFDFITDNLSVCENVPLQLEVSGDGDWAYSWSTGQTGVGLQMVTVTPTAPSASYAVTVTTPEGCMNTETLDLVVSSLVGQVPPTMNGINGTGEYIYYVHEGFPFSFTSTIFNNAGETVDITPTLYPPGLTITQPSGNNGGTIDFSANTSLNQEDLYPVVIHLKDNNGCQELESTYTFIIKVICSHCPVCFDYENRTPQNNPLPSENRAAKCITVAITDPVVVGQGNHVLFQAGEYVTINDDYFDTDGGTFEAVISPTTCVEECNDCCDNFMGFTYDDPGDFVIINTVDDDPTNDFFQLTDSEHPLCAFNAIGWELQIKDRTYTEWLHDSGSSNGQCCVFKSPSPEWPVTHSDIWWDTYKHHDSEVFPLNDQEFYYELHLKGCNGEEVILFGMIVYNPAGSGLAEMPGNGAAQDQASAMQLEAREEMALKERLEEEISLSPNPAHDVVTVNGLDNDDVSVQLYDEKGMVLTGRKPLDGSKSFSISDLSAGTYYVRVYTNGTYIAKKLIKL